MTVEASGTQAATIDTEHSLHTNSSLKTFVLMVNTVNMVAGDELELRVKVKTLAGSTITLAYYASYLNAQQEPIKYSIPTPSPGQTNGIEFTLKQVAGTGRNYEWAVLTL